MDGKSDGVVSDIELVVRARRGDGEARIELAARYRPELHAWVRTGLPAGIGLNRDDLVERALNHVLSRLGELEIGEMHIGHEGRLRVYLRQALFTYIRDRIRRVSRPLPPPSSA